VKRNVHPVLPEYALDIGSRQSRAHLSWSLHRWDRHPLTVLDEDEMLTLKQVKERCPHLDARAGHVTAFAKILAGRHGGQLDNWIAAVDADDQPDLHSFATRLKGDHEAMRNGLTLPWSSGAVEGNVNRIKMLSGRCTAVPDSICASASCSLPDCEGPRPSRKMESHRVDDPGQAGQAAAAVCQRWSHVLAGRYVVVALTRGIAGRGDEFGHPRPSLQMNPTHPRKAGTPGGWAACRGDRAERRAG
jgi:hypothetical protein